MIRPAARHAIRNRLLASMAATVALGIVMTVVVFVVSASTIRSLVNTTTEMDAMNEGAHALLTVLDTQETFVFDFALSSRVDAVEEFQAATGDEETAYADLRTRAAALPDVLAAVTAAHDASVAWREQWAEPFLRSSPADRDRDEAAAVTDSEVLFRPAEIAMSNLIDALGIRRAATRAEIDSAIPRLATVVLPLGLTLTVLLSLLGLWLTRSVNGPLGRLSTTVEALVAGAAVHFAPERDDEIGALALVLERLRVDAGERYDRARLEGEHAGTFNQLAELTSFARDESDLVMAASRAIRRLVPTSAGDIMLANPSQNRLTIGVGWGDNASETGTLVNVDRIDRCPGIRRSAAFVTADVADDMAVRCPAHRSEVGTLACVPMLALGKIVGVIHLESTVTDAFDSEAVRLLTRVAETVGLAMANARLMQTMEGQAMTDPLTGLRNTRFFDPYLEQELESGRRDQQPTSVLMIDIDHFKQFNDTYGHPAGDEALRTFARVVGGSLRASDVAARYGGEEFIVALRHVGIDEARGVAEKLRSSIEQMVVELGPGRYARITASFGVASSGPAVQDQKTLIGLADAALYQAKESGRNRVEVSPTMAGVVVAADRRRRLGQTARDRNGADAAAS